MSNKKSPHPFPLVVISLLLISLLSVKIIVSLFDGDGSILGIETWIAKGGDDDGDDDDGDDDNSGSGSSNSGSSNDDDGDDDDGDDGDDDDFSGSSNSGSSNSDDDDDSKIEDEVKTETEDSSGVRIRTVDKEDDQRTEIKISETERIRTRVKDGITRIDITSGGVKTRLEYEEGRVVIKAEREGLDDVELEDGTIFKIDDRLAKSAIKVSTASAETFLVQRGTAAVQTDFPISIDLETNVLSVDTPSGLKTLTVLPDEVIVNLLVAGIVNRFDSSQLTDKFQAGELAAVTDLLTLEEQNGDLVYEIKGVSDQKLLGFIPVTIEKDIVILAETGEVISERVGFIDRIIDVFSF